jgi:hypothetical protein
MVGVSPDHAQHDGGKQGKEQSRLQMGELEKHQDFSPVAISYTSTIARMFSKPAHTRNFVP